MYAYSDEQNKIKVVGYRNSDKKNFIRHKFKYDRLNDLFFCSWSAENIKRLQDMGCEIAPHVFSHITAEQEKSLALRKVRIPRSISEGMFKYQAEALRYMQAGFSLVAFEMGLGKTPIGLRFIQLNNFRRSIILCPAFLKEKWAYEVGRWTTKTPHVIYRKESTEVSS